MLQSAAICQENELILQVSRGNETAFTQLFTIYSDKLYSFIRSISNSNQLAEDVVQDVFLKVWQKRLELHDIENFNSYLFRMAHNQAVNIMKRMAKETLILAKMTYQSEASKPEFYTALEHKDIHHSYAKAIEKLPLQQKLVFTMSRERGLKQQEIARILNITIPTVKSHMTQALRSLRKVTNDFYLMVPLCVLLL